MPALQGIFNSITEMRYSVSSVDAMYNDIKNLKFFDYSSKIHDQLKVNENITLNNINFHYPNAVKTAIKNLNLSIQSRTTVGIVGATGSGKTTTIDIILGLLEAQQGTLKIDGIEIKKIILGLGKDL